MARAGRLLLCVALLGLLAAAPVVAQNDEGNQKGRGNKGKGKKGGKVEETMEKVQEAINAQSFREEAGEEVVSQIVEEAPEATLESGDADVSTTGECASDIDVFCLEIEPGEGRIAKCLTNAQKEAKKGNNKGRKVSKACGQELRQFKQSRATNINKDVPLALACKKDVTKFCQEEKDWPEPGNFISCLREFKEDLSKDCHDEVFRTMLDAADDFAADAMLFELCKDDADRLCNDVEVGEGRKQACMREQRQHLSWECREELFRQEIEDADDIRLSTELYNTCLNDKKKFCEDVPFGHARIQECLEEHRSDDDFTSECKDKLEAMMERRSRDFRLDAALREVCMDDIEKLCGYEMESLESVAGQDARVLLCLEDYHEELGSEACKAQMHKVMVRASEDIRFDEPLADACYFDREQFCPGVVPGSARVIRCLQDARKDLSVECKAALFDHEVRMAEDIDFQFPMKKACTAEIEKFCSGLQHGHARVIACLQHHMDEEEFGSDCKKATTRLNNRMGQDYRLNHRLAHACETDIESLCSDQCSPFLGQSCGGTVLRCLQDKQKLITSQECQEEVFYFEQMEVSDFRNDVLLAEACRNDVQTYCSDVTPGQGRVHQCLREHMQSLSDACRKEEAKLGRVQAEDVRLRPKLRKACAEEMVVFCKDIKPGKARVFGCLMENMGDASFGSACRGELEKREEQAKSDYRYNPGVALECEVDIDTKCADAKANAHGHAEVLRCLVDQYATLSEACAGEMSRAVRLALWDYKKDKALTSACDGDVEALCPVTKDSRHRGVFTIGMVGRCLGVQAAKGGKLHGECRKLVTVAAPRDAQAAITELALKSNNPTVLARLERSGMLARGSSSSIVTLRGWGALLAVLAMVLVSVVGAAMAYRRVAGLDKPYTVLRDGDEPAAPGAAKPVAATTSS